MMQESDLIKQKIERAMNLIIENENITQDILEKNGIKHIAPSAKHIDSNDGDNISDEELKKLIQMANS